jgi:hypothetical protein
MGLVLIVVGLLVWLLAGWSLIGLVLIIVGLVLLFVPGPFYGYGYWHGRRGPPA